MRIGVMIGPERGRYSTEVDRLRADGRWAEEAGLASVWIPQIPDEFDALTAATLVGAQTTRIEIGTAVVPVQPRHPVTPIALAQQALSVQAVCGGRLSLGLGVPLGRLGNVDDLAGAAVFLASGLSSYVTGQTIHVDGGTSAAGGWYHHPDTGDYVTGPLTSGRDGRLGRRGDGFRSAKPEVMGSGSGTHDLRLSAVEPMTSAPGR